MNKPILLVDCDETLIYSRSNVPGSASFIDKIDKKVEYTIIRPGTKEFLEAVHDRYKVMMVTQGIVSFQEQCLEIHGISHLIDYIYGCLSRTELNFQPHELPPEDKWLLIDNFSDQDWGNTAVKRQWLKQDRFQEGINYLECEPFWGFDNGQSLCELLPKVYEILG